MTKPEGKRFTNDSDSGHDMVMTVMEQSGLTQEKKILGDMIGLLLKQQNRGIWAIPVAVALAIMGSLVSHRTFAKHQVVS